MPSNPLTIIIDMQLLKKNQHCYYLAFIFFLSLRYFMADIIYYDFIALIKML